MDKRKSGLGSMFRGGGSLSGGGRERIAPENVNFVFLQPFEGGCEGSLSLCSSESPIDITLSDCCIRILYFQPISCFNKFYDNTFVSFFYFLFFFICLFIYSIFF